MKKAESIIIGLTIVFLTVSGVFAQTHALGQKHVTWQKESVFQELNLTPEQQKKLAENRKAQREEMTRLLSVIKEKQAKLQEELKSPAVSRAKVESLANEIKALQAQLIDHRVNGIFTVKEILTPQQFAQFQQMTEKRQENRKIRFQNWRERRKGILTK